MVCGVVCGVVAWGGVHLLVDVHHFGIMEKFAMGLSMAEAG